MKVAARTPEPRLSRIYASTTPMSCPRLCITSQTSPAPAAHPARRTTLARNTTDVLRYAATQAPPLIDARAAKGGRLGGTAIFGGPGGGRIWRTRQTARDAGGPRMGPLPRRELPGVETPAPPPAASYDRSIASEATPLPTGQISPGWLARRWCPRSRWMPLACPAPLASGRGAYLRHRRRRWRPVIAC